MANSRVMLITGTRKGIGAQLAKHYVNDGFRVIGCSRKKIDFELDNYQHFYLDVADETKVKKAFLEIKKKIWPGRCPCQQCGDRVSKSHPANSC